MFNPIPPQDPWPPRVEKADPPIDNLFLAGKSRRILGFALKRGLLLAFLLGGPSGILIGLAAPTRYPAFFEDQLVNPGRTFLFWTIATITAFLQQATTIA